MAKDQNIKNYTLQDIARYHAGQLSAAEMNALEKAALEDPFLADAVDGYNENDKDPFAAIRDLKDRLGDRIEETAAQPGAVQMRQRFNWWKVAAMLVLIAGAGALTYQFAFNDKKSDLAENKPADKIVAKDSVLPPANTQSTLQVDSGMPKTVDAPLVNKKAEARATDKLNSQAVAPTVTIQELTTNQSAPGGSVSPVKDQKELVENNVAKVSKVAAETDDADKNSLGFTQPEAKRKALATAPAKNDATYRNAHIFRGRVMDAQSNALPFANITNPIDNVGTYTDANGYFTLTSTDSVLKVQVKSLGFENTAIALNDKRQENRILMQEDHSLSARILDTVKRNTNRVRNATMKLEEPEPADGWSKYDTYIANNLNIPDSYQPQRSRGGEVELSFEVNTIGEPVNIKVERSLCDICDKEAIRLLREGPKWKKKSKKNRTTVTVAF